MDEILDVITRDDGAQLEKILYAVKSKNTSHLDLRTKDYEKLYVFASFSGALNCLLVLSKLGIDINLSASLQCALHDVAVSPLRVAVEYDKVDAVKWLCYQGANVNYREAVWSTKADDITSGMFVSSSCQVPCMTPLHFAQSPECVEILLEHGADMAAQDCMGKTPVSMATLDGRLDVLEALCSHRAPINLASSWGATPLMYAQYARRRLERVSATEVLCRAGADVNLQDRNGRTALHMAKDVECVCLLLSFHADPAIETVFGKTPLITAAENDCWDICRLLYDAQATPSLGALGKETGLFCSLSRDHQTWLLQCSRKVRDLAHLCRSVIRQQLKRQCKNVTQGSKLLPLPSVLKNYISFVVTGEREGL